MLRSCFLIIGFLLPVTFLQSQESPHQFYLLRTGSLLEGTSTQNGTHYVVQTSFGSMNIPIHNVEFVGQTKRDVYFYRQKNIDSTNCHALIQFAEWCLANGLTPEGIAEYQRASQAAPNATLASLIQKRLTELQRPDPPTLPPQSPVQQAESSASSSVSKSMFENYVRKVQPVLVSRCASADCHGTHSNQQFKIGIPRDIMGSTSRNNLQSVLAYVNLDHPTDSVLLSALTTPHSNMKTALSVESEAYLQSVRWVQQVAKEMPLQRNKDQQSQAADEQSTQHDLSVPVRVAALPEQFRRAMPTEERLPIKELPRASNPLDPEVFNERYHSTKRSGER